MVVMVMMVVMLIVVVMVVIVDGDVKGDGNDGCEVKGDMVMMVLVK